jgi:hypothetical protein
MKNKKNNLPYFPLEIRGAVSAESPEHRSARGKSAVRGTVLENVACNVAGSQVGVTRAGNAGQRSHNRDDSP